jgi:LemA protein
MAGHVNRAFLMETTMSSKIVTFLGFAALAFCLPILAQSPAEQGKQENFLQETLKSIFALSEAYPELKANQNFTLLQTQFQELETGIENARRYYNAIVRDYNTAIQVFPTVLFAAILGFKREEFFELESPDEERKPIKPDFS